MATKTPRPKKHYVAAYLLGVAAVALIAALAYPAYKDDRLVPVEAKTSDCQETGQIVEVNFGPASVEPNPINVRQCDIVMFTNKSDAIVELAIGTHDKHVEYPGLEEVLTDPGKTHTLIAVRTGNYRVHDHINDKLSATLSVSE